MGTGTMLVTGCTVEPADVAVSCCADKLFSDASATDTVLKLPLTVPPLCKKVNVLVGEGTNPLSLLISMDPDKEVVPVTLSVSYPVPGVLPPNSRANTLSGPRVRSPSMLSAPGEKPGASVPPFITVLPPTTPLPARKPPLKVAEDPGGKIRLAAAPGLPIRV